MHFVNRDSLGLANDFLSLGFIPEGEDIQLVADALRTTFSAESRQSNDFQVCIPISFYVLWNLLMIAYCLVTTCTFFQCKTRILLNLY